MSTARDCCAAAGAVFWAGRSGVATSEGSPIVATTSFTATVSPAWTLISVRTPDAGAGISASTLSVEISNSGSSRSTESPTCLIQRTIVPSAIDSPIWGITTGVDIVRTVRIVRIVLHVYGCPMRGVGSLGHGLREGRMRVDRLDQLLNRALEPQGQHRLGDEFGGP